jgi:hypothetical protein
MRLNIPGINGSLGECVICGDTFLFEIVMAKRIKWITVTGFDRDLPAHEKCARKAQAIKGDWHNLPPGPLRSEFEKGAPAA